MRSSTATSDAWQQHSVAPMEERSFFGGPSRAVKGSRGPERGSRGGRAKKDNWRGGLDAMENGCKLEKAVA